MLLTFDVGNTNIKIGKFNKDKLVDVFRVKTDKSRLSDEYAMILKPVFKDVTSVIISSVVPELNIILRNMCINHLNTTPLFVGPGIKTGINIKADNPKEVGADLVCGAVGGLNYNDTCLIIDLGTASTFTYVDNAVIKGVIISTGLNTQKDALINNTSLLPQFELAVPKTILGSNTTDCLKSGLLFGHAAMIDGIIKRVRNEVKKDFKVICTGGLSKLIAPLCYEDLIIDNNLIINGLKDIYHKNIV